MSIFMSDMPRLLRCVFVDTDSNTLIKLKQRNIFYMYYPIQGIVSMQCNAKLHQSLVVPNQISCPSVQDVESVSWTLQLSKDEFPFAFEQINTGIISDLKLRVPVQSSHQPAAIMSEQEQDLPRRSPTFVRDPAMSFGHESVNIQCPHCREFIRTRF